MSSQGISLLPDGGGRHPADCDLYCEIEGVRAEVRAGDLSKAGLFVQTATPPEVDSEVELFLRSEVGEATVRGLVVQVITCQRAVNEGRAPGFGLLFLNLTPAHRQWVEQTLVAIRARHPKLRPRPRSAPQMPSAPPDRRPLTPKQRRLERERQQTLSDLKAHLTKIQQRPPWTVLGVDANASEGDSKTAYFELSKRYHPHLYARYDSTEISETVTDIFIATKRAYTAMRQNSVRPRQTSRRSPGARSREPGANAGRASLRASASPANDTHPLAEPKSGRARTSDPAARAERETTAGIKLLATRRFARAKAKFNSALQLMPESEAAKVWLLVCEARELKEQQRDDEALAKYRAVLELDQNHREALEETARGSARRRGRLLGRFFGSGDK